MASKRNWLPTQANRRGFMEANVRDHTGLPLYHNPTHWCHGIPLAVFSAISRYNGYVWQADDFLDYNGPLTAGAVGGWTAVDTNTSTIGLGTTFNTDGNLLLTTDANDNDYVILQRNGEAWTYVSGQEMWFGIRVASNDVDDGEVLFGLVPTGYNSVLSTLPADGIFWEKAETATNFDFHVRKNGTSTESTALGTTLVDGTSHVYGFHIHANGTISVFEDNVQVAAVAAGDTNIVDDEPLSPTFAIQTGATDAIALNVGFYFVCKAGRTVAFD